MADGVAVRRADVSTAGARRLTLTLTLALTLTLTLTPTQTLTSHGVELSLLEGALVGVSLYLE